MLFCVSLDIYTTGSNVETHVFCPKATGPDCIERAATNDPGEMLASTGRPAPAMAAQRMKGITRFGGSSQMKRLRMWIAHQA